MLSISETKGCSTSVDLDMSQYDTLVTFYAIIISMILISGGTKIRCLQNGKWLSFLLFFWAENSVRNFPFPTDKVDLLLESWISIQKVNKTSRSSSPTLCSCRILVGVLELGFIFPLVLWFQNTKGQRCAITVNSRTNREDSVPLYYQHHDYFAKSLWTF